MPRLQHESWLLKRSHQTRRTPYICNDLNGTLVSILGKTKAFWNETKSFQNCVVCGATPTQLAVQDHEVFKNEPIEKLRHGLSNCHLPMKIISWLFKGTEYQDFAYHECYRENRHLADARKEEYQVILTDLLLKL